MFKKILVPLDGSALAEQALATAATVLARGGGPSGSIELLYVDTNASRRESFDPTDAGDPLERIYVNGIAEEASRLLGVPVTGVVRGGDPATTIVQRARELSADVIVMTTHGRTGLRRTVFGSVADRVVYEAGRPVLVQRPVVNRRWRAMVIRGFTRILVPLDGSDEAMRVISPALDLCRWMQARLVLGRVVAPIPLMTFSDAGVPAYAIVDEVETQQVVDRARDALIELALDIEADRRLRVETMVEVGNDIGKTLLQMAERCDADLLALATQTRGATRLIFGSVTDRLLRDGHLPLLLLHPQPSMVPVAAPAPVAAAVSATEGMDEEC